MAKKLRAIHLDDEIYEKISAVYKLKNFRTISEFVDNAIKEWFARDAGQEVSMYISKQLVSLVENTIRMSEQRIKRILFKIAVSDAEMKHVLAEYFSLDEGFLEDAHDRSIREVRQNNGILNLSQVMSEAREGEKE